MKTPIINFNNFGFKYKSQQEPTLFDINLTINKGEKVLILGPSGSGKSTLANCMNGLIPFSYDGELTGSVEIAGIETKNASIFKLSKHIGTVLQDSDAQFVGLSVGEDIAFALENENMPRKEMIPLVEEASKKVGMLDFLNHVPYDLSGGQKQKVALAGVLHGDIDVLLFDEPLAALDPKMGMFAVDLIDQIHSNDDKTIVIIEHRFEDVLYRHIDRVILMNEGRIVADTTPDKLLEGDLLHKFGIREPLYVTSLKYAGCELKETDHPSDLEKLDITRFKDALLKHNQLKTLEHIPSKGDVLVEVKDVSFSYGKGNVVEDINFTINKKERIALIGKNGAGKSTMAKLLTGILRPKTGEIKIDSNNYITLTIKEIGEKIGYVMQNPNQMLVKDIIVEEVEMALRLRNLTDEQVNERVCEALKMCGLYSMRNWPVSAVSYGQRKRITIAAILALKPEMLILDEPTAGQDHHHYTEIMSFLDELNKKFNVTIIFITHDMHLAIEYTDRAIVFSDGHLIADDSVFKVLSNNEVIEKANLKQTSLYTLAKKLDLNPEAFIKHFIEYERMVKSNEQ